MRGFIALIIILVSNVNAQPFVVNWLCANSAMGALNDEGRSVVEYQNNNYVIGSFKSNTIAFGAITLTNTFSGTSDIFIAKYTNCGVVVWAKSFGTVNDDQGITITHDGIGNFYFSGSFNSSSISIGSFTLNNNGGDDFFIAKMDVNANIVWANAWGGVGNEVPKYIDARFNSNVNLVGDYTGDFSIGSNTLSNAGNNDFFYMQISPSGTVIVAKGYGSSGDEKVTCGGYRYGTNDILITGIFNSSTMTVGAGSLTNNNAGTYDSFIIQLNPGFTETWVLSIGNSGDDFINSFLDSYNALNLVGHFNSATLTIGGFSLVNSNVSTSDAFFASYNSGGTPTEAYKIGGIGNEELRSIDFGNPFILSGIYDSPSLTLPFGNVLVNSNAGTFDLFSCMFFLNSVPAGAFVNGRTAGGSGDDVVFNSGSCWNSASSRTDFTGSFSGATCSFSTVSTLTNSGGNDFFLSSLTCYNVQGVLEQNEKSTINLYPNPVNESLTIMAGARSKVYIFNILGQNIYEDEFIGSKEIDFSLMAKGIYLVIYSNIEGVYTSKIIKE